MISKDFQQLKVSTMYLIWRIWPSAHINCYLLADFGDNLYESYQDNIYRWLFNLVPAKSANLNLSQISIVLQYALCLQSE